MQTLHAVSAVDISQSKQVSLLQNSDIYIDDQAHSLETLINKKLFHPYNASYINTGMLDSNIWISFSLSNSSKVPVKKILILTSPLLEHIGLFTKDNLTEPQLQGVSHIQEEHSTLFPYYSIVLPAGSSQEYYLQVRSKLTPVDFTLRVEEEKSYTHEDRTHQFIDILLIGFVLALSFYSFVLFFYTKDKSYLFYSFYLSALIWQQITYLGLTQIYFPLQIIAWDMQIPVFKVNLLIITAALFAMYFLKTESIPVLHRIYKFFIILSSVEIILLSLSYFYNLDIIIFTGLMFIIFNLSAAIISYKKGRKQARLFIVGFGVVFFSYLLMILDAIGLTSIMQDFQNILMFGTAFEALVLSIAFADRYLILQTEKSRVDQQILRESKQRTELIEKEVEHKTKALNHALQGKELLLKEVHHRVKNNLQIILSMIRLQNDDIEDTETTEKLTNLENRINAISKTYNMLLIKDDIEEIDMQEYIETLLLDIDRSLSNDQQEINIETDIDAIIPLRESVYVGLIVNELVTNAYKYAFEGSGTIFISLKHDENKYVLIIEDDGKGYTQEKTHHSLGLKLVQTLIYDQLGGHMDVDTKEHTKYTIRFTL